MNVYAVLLDTRLSLGVQMLWISREYGSAAYHNLPLTVSFTRAEPWYPIHHLSDILPSIATGTTLHFWHPTGFPSIPTSPPGQLQLQGGHFSLSAPEYSYILVVSHRRNAAFLLRVWRCIGQGVHETSAQARFRVSNSRI
jgi:hypothetical protein